MKTPIRDMDRIKSEFNRWVYENCGSEFFFGDIDGVAYKRATRILRIIEWKHIGESLSAGQSVYLPILDSVIRVGVALNLIEEGSGVFIIRGNPPLWDGGIRYQRIGKDEKETTVDRLISLVGCKKS